MFVQAIVTKYLGPTNTLPGRIKATASAGTLTVPYESGLSTNANHTAAAHALARKFGWMGHYQGGGMPDGNGNVYVRNGHNLHLRAGVWECDFHIETDPVTGEAVPASTHPRD